MNKEKDLTGFLQAEVLLCPALLSKPEIPTSPPVETAASTNGDTTAVPPVLAASSDTVHKGQNMPKFGPASDIDYIPELIIGQLNGHGTGNSAPVESATNGDENNNTHWLLYNKFNVFRPQYLVLTIDSHLRQTSPLDLSDVTVAWQMVHSPKTTTTDTGASEPGDKSHKQQRRWVVIYNCGPKAGCSREHKHVQVFDRRDLAGDGTERGVDRFEMFREAEKRANKPTSDGDGVVHDGDESKGGLAVPFRFYRYDLSDMQHDPNAPEKVLEIYLDMLEKCKKVLGLGDEVTEVPHNVLMTDDEFIVIPRSKAEFEEVSANAVGMMGVLWVSKEEKVERWKRLGAMRVLKELGVPW